MILAIDIGNTNIVMGALDDQKTYFTSRIATDKRKTEDQYAVELENILKLYGLDWKALGGAIISSVVPQLSGVLKAAIQKVTGFLPMIVEPGMKTGLDIRIDNPAQLGSDLVVSSAAAIAKYPTPLVVLDFGTATTLVVVDNGNTVLGGMIIPGISVSVDALISRTSQLQGISLENPKHLIGTNTVDCMKSGVIYGAAAMFDGLIARIEQKLGKKVTSIATGGLARYIVPHCQVKIINDQNLMLDGLYILYKKNVSKQEK